MIEISGFVEEIIYSNYENGYTVCMLDVNGEPVTATGCMPYLSEGENVSLTGDWVNHREYGMQFKASTYEKVQPSTEEGILRYLGSGIIRGIGLATAQRIVSEFGEDALNVLMTAPERLACIKGISKAKALQIGESYLKQQSVQQTVMFLQTYGISAAMALKVQRALGTDAVNLIKQNPYVLVSAVHGISFKTADRVAMQMGTPPNSKSRIKAALEYILLSNAYERGHTYLPERELLDTVCRMLEVDGEEAVGALISLAIEGHVSVETIRDVRCAFLNTFLRAERSIGARIAALLKEKPFYTEKKAVQRVDDWQKSSSIQLGEKQREAVICALTNRIMVLTGGPGTGKTTVVNTIMDILKQDDYKIALAAPTGRAAKRLGEVTGSAASTIHRLLEIEYMEEGEAQVFARDAMHPLDEDVVIVDESSMIDVLLGSALLSAVRNDSAVIFVGDADQLPPVGAGNMFADIIKSGVVKTVRLTEIFRQAAQSLFVQNAHRIIHGENPVLDDVKSDFFYTERTSAETIAQTVAELYKTRLPQAYGFDALRQIQVLSPMRKGICGVQQLNALLQQSINPPSKEKAEHRMGDVVFRVGDKVMQIKNNYDIGWSSLTSNAFGQGVFNGDIGYVTGVDKENKVLTVVYDEDKEVHYMFEQAVELELAYAVTVHKSQGSEFDAVVMPVYHAAPMLMKRNLFYTAVTRAKKLVVLVGVKSAVAAMTANDTENLRFTSLQERLLQLAEEGAHA